MDISSRSGSTNGQALKARPTEKTAFEGYLRRGHVSGRQSGQFQGAADLTLKAVGGTRPTAYYTWRTARDERVRSAHAANEGSIFAWTDPPAGGNPGDAHNCRCWAEPYYGTPMILDARLPLRRQFEVDTAGREPWVSIETQVRPDGSLARSTIELRDGARIHSTFVGSSVTHSVRLSAGQNVRVEKRDGVQSIFVGSASVPTRQSVWTPEGPKIAMRRLVAQGPAAGLGPVNEFEEIELIDPSRLTPPAPDALLAAGGAGLALLWLFNVLSTRPKTLGAGGEDVGALAFRVWTDDRGRDATAVALAALTAEQVAQTCRRLTDVRSWTDGAVEELAASRAGMSPQQWGTAVHKRVQREVDRLRSEFPRDYSDVDAEVSIDPDDPHANVYGRSGSTRLDVTEEVGEDLICVYDIKTGATGLTPKRVAQIAAMIVLRYGPATFFIIEVRPSR